MYNRQTKQKKQKNPHATANSYNYESYQKVTLRMCHHAIKSNNPKKCKINLY